MTTDLRLQVLNPQESFLVQAPAGSGKTEILTQRFLRLLAQVNSPEEIIAITFTRKAANEMRNRILNALTLAQQTQSNISSHQQITLQLATAALKNSEAQDWHLLQNPNRLRILTIDALAASLCAQMPVLTEFGAPPKIIENATSYYQQAIYHLLNFPEHHVYIETLLLHLDNNFKLLEKLFIDMLSKRDQWLSHIIDHHRDPQTLKTMLQQGLSEIVIEKITKLKTAIPQNIIHSLVECASFAAQHLPPNHPIAACTSLTQLPNTTLIDFPIWLGIAELLLTKTGQWRKQVNKTCGFPAHAKTEKQQMQALLNEVQHNEIFYQQLVDVQNCPPTQYQTNQWEIIHALVYLLPLLAAELKLVFQEQGVIDFTEVTQGALRALGDSTTPTNLALHLDYQIQHLLIDEFQDTSISQFCLFEQLMRGWQPGDGRSIFLVGDPMQSIYRFRQAEVGLFLRAKINGIGSIPLTNITLAENFRSRPEILSWINQAFNIILPKHMDILCGAVPYTSAQPMRDANSASGVHLYPLLNASDQDEAQQIVAIAQQCLQQHPTQTVAILVRSRQPLITITAALRQANLAFHALDIETLYHRAEIQDLLSLTRALTHLGDRIAWLAILRAPWCGLTLHDLHVITHDDETKLIWSSLLNFNAMTNLSDDGKKRLQRVVPILAKSLQSQGRLPLSAWLEGTWIALGGPATLPDEAALQNAQQFMQILTTISDEFTIENLTLQLKQNYAQIDTDLNSRIQIMTIHKAKGLEFDHVILPNLHRKVSVDQQRLLLWLESPTQSREDTLLLAPIKAASEDQEPIYEYLKMIEKSKADHESQRLLYVAATRAKESLHLIGKVVSDLEDPTKLKKPAAGSFLDILWPFCHDEIIKNIISHESKLMSEERTVVKLRRLVSNWQSPLEISSGDCSE